jgi:hypothetical protein
VPCTCLSGRGICCIGGPGCRRLGAAGDPPGYPAHHRGGWVQVDRARRRRRHRLAAFRRLRGHVVVAAGTCAWPDPLAVLAAQARPGPGCPAAPGARQAAARSGPGRLMRAAIILRCQHVGHPLRHLLNRAGQGPAGQASRLNAASAAASPASCPGPAGWSGRLTPSPAAPMGEGRRRGSCPAAARGARRQAGRAGKGNRVSLSRACGLLLALHPARSARSAGRGASPRTRRRAARRQPGCWCGCGRRGRCGADLRVGQPAGVASALRLTGPGHCWPPGG